MLRVVRRAIGTVLILLALAPVRPAFAHDGGEIYGGWSLSPEIVVPLLLTVALYERGWRQLERRGSRSNWAGRAVAFYTGIAVLLVALISPVDTFGDELLAAHMVQHLLLIQLAPPLLVLGTPLTPLLWGLPAPLRRALGRQLGPQRLLRRLLGPLLNPWLVWLLHVGTLWLWHLPVPYEAAVVSEPIHIAEHLTFLLSALLFWWLVIYPLPRRRPLSYGLTLLYLFATMVQSSLLGALMSMARRPWYGVYERVAVRPWGLSALDDQQLAGLIMWVPAGALYIAAILAVGVAWTQHEQRRTRRLHQQTLRDSPG